MNNTNADLIVIWIHQVDVPQAYRYVNTLGSTASKFGIHDVNLLQRAETVPLPTKV